MTYVFVVVAVLAVVGVVMWVVAVVRPGTDATPTEVDHTPRTSRDTVPPPHPDRPVPGSAADRGADPDSTPRES